MIISKFNSLSIIDCRRHSPIFPLTKLAKITFPSENLQRGHLSGITPHFYRNKNNHFSFTPFLHLKTVRVAACRFTSAQMLSVFSSAELKNRIVNLQKNGRYLKEIDEIPRFLDTGYHLEGTLKKTISLSQQILKVQEKDNDLRNLGKSHIFQEDLKNCFYGFTGATHQLGIRSINLTDSQERALKSLETLIENAKKLIG